MPAAPMELTEVANGPVNIKTIKEMHDRISIITRPTATILKRERATGRGQEDATMADKNTLRADRDILARARVAVIVDTEDIPLIDIIIGAAIAQDRDRVHQDDITEADVTRALPLHVVIIQGGGATRVLPLPIEVEIDVTVRPRLAAEILLGPRLRLSPGAHDSTESLTRRQCPPVHRPCRLIGITSSAKDVRDSTATLVFAATTQKANYRYDRAFFLYDCRQGLGPVATTLDCSHIPATPGFHVRDVLTVDQTRQIFNQPGRPYFHRSAKELDYRKFGTIQEEALKVPATPQLGRGPPPSLHTRAGDVHLPGTSNDLALRVSQSQPQAQICRHRGATQRATVRGQLSSGSADTSMPLSTPQPALRDHHTSMSHSRAQLREAGQLSSRVSDPSDLQRSGIKTETDIDAHQKPLKWRAMGTNHQPSKRSGIARDTSKSCCHPQLSAANAATYTSTLRYILIRTYQPR
ncbi:hypothetical protein F4679DRAFT_595770 [Xylaria curta]|nr:hypothetical protein F4679DRAFT_595770 [Xylaria curta]